MTRRTASRAVTACLVAAFVAAAWLAFAPAGLGGSMRYAIIDGASMQPILRAGDLAIVRPTADPAVGDVVLYRDPALGVQLLHRVVGRAGDRLVVKGDSNDFTDDARPRATEITGSLWFSVPRAGSAVAWTRHPTHAALLAFVFTIAALAGGGSSRGSTREEAARP